jgi:hypothetical protein
MYNNASVVVVNAAVVGLAHGSVFRCATTKGGFGGKPTLHLT